jgi:hypothetical protein
LQLGLGLSGIAGGFDDFSDGTKSIAFVGGSGSFHVAIGGTVDPGLVVGATLHSITPFQLRVREDGDTHSTGTTDIALLGAFVDWYFKPEKGFHLQGAIGPSFATLKGNGRYFADDDFSGTGAGMMVGFGYEAFVSKDWSLGGLAQLQIGGVRLKGDDTDEKFDLGYAAPSLLFNATFH